MVEQARVMWGKIPEASKQKLSLNQNNQIKEVPPERGAFQTPQGESLGQNEKSGSGHSGDKETKPTQDKKIEFRYSLSL